jgi:enterochelin esterase-like enzyme
MQIAANRRMAETLTSKDYAVHYFEYDGGHSFLNWSEGMARGLQYMLGAENPAAKRAGSPK